MITNAGAPGCQPPASPPALALGTSKEAAARTWHASHMGADTHTHTHTLHAACGACLAAAMLALASCPHRKVYTPNTAKIPAANLEKKCGTVLNCLYQVFTRHLCSVIPQVHAREICAESSSSSQLRATPHP